MNRQFRIITPAAITLLLCSCAIDYSPVQLAPVGTAQAHLASGIIGESSGAVFIEAVNDVAISQPAPGREVIASAGMASLKLHYVYANQYNNTKLSQYLMPDKYYIIIGTPNKAGTFIAYKVSEATNKEFKDFQCETQRKAQRNLSGINPQKAPACD
jgi:hypothetical protein